VSENTPPEQSSRPALVCRYCERPIAVPASSCPWCRRRIMVICSVCKSYTDDQLPTCQHCGAPLQPDTMEAVIRLTRHQALGELAQDQSRALLVASAVLAANMSEFLFAAPRAQPSVLIDLLGSAHDHRTTAAAVVLGAYGYLAVRGYCALSWDAAQRRISFIALRPWDGQHACLERALAEQSMWVSTTYEASQRAIEELMGFRASTMRVRSADGRSLTRVPLRSPFAAIDHLARLTVLPPQDRRVACRETYQLLCEFVEADPERARQLAVETLRLLDWLAAQQPSA
jgi:hypothetical protein